MKYTILDLVIIKHQAMKSTLLVILSLLIFSIVNADIPLDSSLVACYDFNGNANDLTGNGYDGTVINATLTTDRNGNPNSAYDFNGVDSYIDLSSDFDLPERMINFWFSADTITTYTKVMYDSDHAGLSYGFTKVRVLEVGGVNVIRMSAGANSEQVDTVISQNQWYMVSVCYSASMNEVKYYLDGILMFSGFANTVVSNTGSTTVQLGASRLLDRFFDGKIDDLRIYNRCLSTEELRDLKDGVSCATILAAGELDTHKKSASVYPNPMNLNSTVYFDNEDREKHILTFYDANGRLVKVIENITEDYVVIERGDLSSGLYQYHLQSDNGETVSGKLMIE